MINVARPLRSTGSLIRPEAERCPRHINDEGLGSRISRVPSIVEVTYGATCSSTGCTCIQECVRDKHPMVELMRMIKCLEMVRGIELINSLSLYLSWRRSRTLSSTIS